MPVRKIGVTITGANVTGDIADAGQGAQIIAHENVLNRHERSHGQKSCSAGRSLAHRYLCIRSERSVL